MGDRIDAEGGLLDDENSEDSGIDETTLPVTPTKTSDEHGEHDTHDEDDAEEVLVLPSDNWALIQIGNVSSAHSLWVLSHDHPSEMRVQKALADGVWILLGIGISVMSSVASCPPSDGAFNGTTTNKGKVDLEREGGGV